MESLTSWIGFLTMVIVALTAYLLVFYKNKSTQIEKDLARLTQAQPLKYKLHERNRKKTQYSKYTKFLSNIMSEDMLEYFINLFKIDYEGIDEQIVLIGLDKSLSAFEIIMLKLLGIIVGSVLIILAIFANQSPLFMLGIAVFIFLFFMPTTIIGIKINKRKKAIEKELPDWIDLLRSVIETGLTLQESIKKIVKSRPGFVSEEFSYVITLTETDKAGEYDIWEKSLEKMEQRNNIQTLSELINNIIISNSRGTPIADTLKTESYRIRETRKSQIKEQAEKMSIKILPVILIFCFMPFLILLLSPALASIVDAL